LFSERSREKIGNALILDSSNFITRDALISVGYDGDNILIPQYDSDEFKIQETLHPRVFNKSLNAFIQDSDDTEFSAAFFDYTCTFSGNEGCHPKNDIDLYFSRKFAADGSTFAVTFSKREKLDEENLIATTKKSICAIAKKNGYALTDDVVFEYDTMYFIMWEVVERKK
jgi:hypothetical protein